MATQRAWWAADFETTPKPDKQTGRVRVWSWAIKWVEGTGDDYEPPADYYQGTDISEFVDQACALGGIFWFHHLKFDASFLDAYLIDELGMECRVQTTGNPPVGSFSAMVSSRGGHFQRRVNRELGMFECRDSLKKFPGTSIATLAETYGTDMRKGTIDYHKDRPIGYQPTDEEWAYQRNDVEILATALKVPYEHGMRSLTIGADALNEYKALHGFSRFRRTFPVLDEEVEDELRFAYRGGWAYTNPKYQGQLMQNIEGSVFDVNSMYPSVMVDNLFPVGSPVRISPWSEAPETHPLWIKGGLISGRLRPGMLPMVQVKRNFRYPANQYLEEFEHVEWYGTNVDWELLHKHYEIEQMGCNGGFAFKGETGLFDRFMSKWMEIKETSEGGHRDYAKYQLNNLWGKFSTTPIRSSKIPAHDKSGISYNTQPAVRIESVYLPVGIWTTSYGRAKVIKAAQSFGDRFLAGDTDSCHVLGTDPGELDIHPTRIGAWKREKTFDQAVYLRPKAYANRIVEDNGDKDIQVHISGLPRALTEGSTMEEIRMGAHWLGKLTPAYVPGGCILNETDYVIGGQTT